MWKIVGMGFMLLVFVAEPLVAATFTVTTTADSADGACDAHCSLREAVIAANEAPGTDDIHLSEGVYELTLSGADEDAALAGDLDITDSVNVFGVGWNRTVLDGLDADRVLDVQPQANPVQIADLAIRGGVAVEGAGVRAGIGSYLHLSSVACVGNTASVKGGGVLARHSLVVADCLFAANTSGSLGGAVKAEGSTEILRSTFVGNRAVNGGGGLVTSQGELVTVDATVFAGNTAIYGGAVSVDRGDVAFTNSTFTGNGTRSGRGGALMSNGGTFVFRNCTLADNGSVGDGTDLAGNNEPEITVENTVLVSPGGMDSCSESISVVSAGHNMTNDASCGLDAAGDVSAEEPGLRSLRDNGGSTLTVGLLQGSPAIDAGGGQSESTDQRGVARPVGAAPDIGAYEASGDEPPIGTPLTVPVVAHVGGVGGTPWRSDVAVTNPGDSQIGATLRYTPGGGAAVEQWLTLAPGATVLYEDIVSSTFGAGDGRGTLVVLSSETQQPPVVASRTFAESGAERLGQGMPAADPYPEGTYFIPGLREDDEYRSNIGVAAGDEDVTVQVDLFRGDVGAVGSTFAQTVPAGTQQQWRLPSMFPGLAQAGVPMTAEVRMFGEGVAYGSLVDQLSTDAVTLIAREARPAGIVPVVAHNPGSEGTFWRSDLFIHNPNPVAAKVYLEYLPEATDNTEGGARVEPIGVEPRATITIADVAGTVFGIADGKGVLNVVGAPGIAVASRTYTTRAGGGTYGLGVPALPVWARTARPLMLTGIRDGGGYRTNIGLVGGERREGYLVELLDLDGSVIADEYLYVEARSLVQLSIRDLFPGVDWGAFSVGSVRLNGAGQVRAAYSSTVDGSSQDPIFVMATPVR